MFEDLKIKNMADSSSEEAFSDSDKKDKSRHNHKQRQSNKGRKNEDGARKRRSYSSSEEEKDYSRKKHKRKEQNDRDDSSDEERTEAPTKRKKTVEKENVLRERLKQKYLDRDKTSSDSKKKKDNLYKREKSPVQKESSHRKQEHESRSKHRDIEYNRRSEDERSSQKHERSSKGESRHRNDRYEKDNKKSGHHSRSEREWDKGKSTTDHRSGQSNQTNWDNKQKPPEMHKPPETFHDFKGGDAKKAEPVVKEEPNFKLSGKLTEYTNTYNGIVIMYNEPAESRKPKTRWRLYPFKGEEALPMLALHRQSAFLLGRDRKVADIPVDHPSCSKQHAVLQFRLVDYERPDGQMGRKVKPYIIDLESTNGTFVNNNKVDPRRYVELIEKDVLKFGFSSREYVILHEKSEDIDSDKDDGEAEGEGDVKKEDQEVVVKKEK